MFGNMLERIRGKETRITVYVDKHGTGAYQEYTLVHNERSGMVVIEDGPDGGASVTIFGEVRGAGED